MSAYAVSQAPHIRVSDSARLRAWLLVLALLPCMLASLVFFGWQALRVLSTALVSGIALELIFAALQRRAWDYRDAGTPLMVLLLGLLLPAQIPLWMIVLACVIAIVPGKMMFGGDGHYLLHPAALACAFLWISFPSWMSASAEPFSQLAGLSPGELLKQQRFEEMPSLIRLFLGLHAGAIGTTSVLAISFSTVFLILRRLVKWEIPLLYLGVSFLAAEVFAGHGGMYLLSSPVFFTAAFLVTDTVTTAHTRSGVRLQTAVAALLAVLIQHYSFYPDGCLFGVLIASALRPWIDRWIRPKQTRRSGATPLRRRRKPARKRGDQ